MDLITFVNIIISTSATLKDTLMSKNTGVSLSTPWKRPNSVIYTPKWDDEYPQPFCMGMGVGCF